MRKLLGVLTALIMFAAPAWGQSSKAALTSQINTNFADNITGLITPLKLRTVMTSIVNSYVDWLTCTGTGGVVYWNLGTPTCLSPGSSGQVLKFNGSLPSWSDVSTGVLAGTGITVSGTSPVTVSLTSQIVAGGPTGSATAIPVVTYNAQGQLTAVTSIFPFNNQGSTSTVLHGNAAGNPSFGSVVTADLNITPTTCTNQFLTALSSGAAGTCTTASLTGAQFANQGTTTTLLHGNAAGNPSFGQVVYNDVAAAALATSSQYASGAASTIVPASVIYPTETTTAFSSNTVNLDFSTFINTAITLSGGNLLTMNVSNVTAGKAGTIAFIQDATGSRTTVWNSVFKFAGGSAPTLTTTANAVDILSYSCRSATFCFANLSKDVR